MLKALYIMLKTLYIMLKTFYSMLKPFTLCSRHFTLCSLQKMTVCSLQLFFYPLSFKTSNYQIFQFPSWSTCFWYPACACTLKNWLEWLILWVLSKLISWWFKPRLNISYGGWVIDFFLLTWGVNGYCLRVESRESNRVMDYNAPPNSWTFGRAQQVFELSLGLSNFIPIYVAYIEECMHTSNLANFCLKL